MSNQASKNITRVENGLRTEDRTGQGKSMTRRAFLRTMTMSAAALAATACGGGGGAAASPGQSDTSLTTGASHSPVWDTIPTITFTQGIAASFSIAAYVSDEDNDTLAITKNSAALPAGVTYDPATKSFVYDGVGAVAYTDGHILTASEG